MRTSLCVKLLTVTVSVALTHSMCSNEQSTPVGSGSSHPPASSVVADDDSSSVVDDGGSRHPSVVLAETGDSAPKIPGARITIDEPTTPEEADFRQADMAIFKTITPVIRIDFAQDVQEGKFHVWLDNGINEPRLEDRDKIEITSLFEPDTADPTRLVLKAVYRGGVPATFPLVGAPVKFPANGSRSEDPKTGPVAEGSIFRKGPNRIVASSTAGAGDAEQLLAQFLLYTIPAEPLFFLDPNDLWVTVGSDTFLRHHILIAIRETKRAKKEDIFELVLNDAQISELFQRNNIVPVAGTPNTGVFTGKARFTGADAEFAKWIEHVAAKEPDVAAALPSLADGLDKLD